MVGRTARLVALLVAAACLYIAVQAAGTLRTLDAVERERDTWQRPGEILRQLNVGPGSTVVDLGSGAGYFALKIAPRIVPGGRVLAVDLRREALAFLWMRAMLRGYWHVHVIHGEVADPRLPADPVDAVLIANTYHELTAPSAILNALRTTMRAGARLVVVDREPRNGGPQHHEIDAAAAEVQIAQAGFEPVSRESQFIDRSGEEDVWWMMVFRKR
jgi:predicted methyltransferase